MRVFALVFCLIIIGAVAARADLPEGTDAPEIRGSEWFNTDSPITMADSKGLVVILYFWVSFHDGGEAAIGELNSIDNHHAMGRGAGVMVLGVTEAEKEQAESMLREQKVSFPVLLGSKSYEDYRISSFPRAVIINADGKVVFTGHPASEDFAKAFVATLEDPEPSKTHPLEVPKVKKLLDESRDAIRSGEFRTAIKDAKDAAEKAVRGDELLTDADNLLDLITAIGEDRLADVDTQVEAGKFSDAVRSLRSLSRDFRGLEIAQTARDRIDTLRQLHPEIENLMADEDAEEESRLALFEAQQLIRKRRFGEAYVALEAIVDEYGETESADAAERTCKRMEQHEPIMAIVRDHVAKRDCENWLSLARNFARQKRNDKAREMYERILDTYPQTSYADTATRELGRLR
jgi:tetratricopeptide (TPR) repeat protein